MHLHCIRCGRHLPSEPLQWRCDCGGPLDIAEWPPFDPSQTVGDNFTLWRYRAALPLPDAGKPVTLGEGWTPLVPARWRSRRVYFKAEHLNPTGSFKDRGATVLVTTLRAAGVHHVVEDSSGNAGAALAAYTGRAGIRATVYIPAYASPVKRHQITVYGAQVVLVPGPRSAATEAVMQAVAQGTAYASHVYAPVYIQGMKTIAFEIWEQLDRRAPSDILLPVGHGTLLLGIYKGFVELRSQGIIEDLPRLFGVQASACAPLVLAWDRGRPVAPGGEGETIAEGVRIGDPPWGERVIAAVRESDGALLAFDDRATSRAQAALARRGLYVEPTSALAVAALDVLSDRLGDTPVVVLTGSGFKTPVATDWQRRVADFAARHGLRHPPAVHALDLVSEVGEVAKEILLATSYGDHDLRPRPELTEELGDALYSLLLLTESCGVRAEEALDGALNKYRARLEIRGEAGSQEDQNAMKADAITEFQQRLGYYFHDRNLLLQALTHPSYLNEHSDKQDDNQRLEFLGDAVLDFLAGEWIYRRYPNFREGRMTQLRAALVRTQTLARFARRIGLDRVLRLGHGEESAGGRTRDANLCDAFEALAGAIYLDGGLTPVRAFFEPLIAPTAEQVLISETDKDPKSRFQEWSQAKDKITPRYRIVAEHGPDHAKTFVAEVLLGDRVVGRGTGRSKQAAERAAAQEALNAVRNTGSESNDGR